ncbi:MAG: trehalase family glycosidase, partial [Armatimonadota bacterium]
ARMAKILQRSAEAEALARDHELMRDRVNASLWDDREGVYFSRHWDGRLEARPTLASFYPLIAGIPTRMRAETMVRHALGNPQSWVGWPLPTLSPEDPAHDPAAPWRGAVSPVSNYIIYAGLKRSGYDDVAAQLAQRSGALSRKQSGLGGGWRNWYDAATGEGIGAGWQRSGALLPLMALQEPADAGR